MVTSFVKLCMGRMFELNHVIDIVHSFFLIKLLVSLNAMYCKLNTRPAGYKTQTECFISYTGIK